MSALKSIRQTFLPDPFCVFVKVDASQIEDRMCKMYCRTPRMVELANTKPWEYDTHTESGKAIFGKDKITPQERYLGKTTVHGLWRDLGAEKMSESISKGTDGKLFITVKDCQKLIDKAHQVMPEIKEVFMPWVRKEIQTFGRLVNSWGRVWDVTDLRIDADLYRKGYSFPSQSEDADWTNQYGVRPGHFYMMTRYGKPLNMQIHDEVIPRGSGLKVTIPVEIKVSTTLYGGVEFKRFPERGAFDKKVNEYLEKEKSDAKS